MKSALRKSPIPTNLIFVAKYLDEARFDPMWHFHPEYQLFIVLSGTGTRFIGDNVSNYLPGELTFTGPNLPHLWRSDDDQGPSEGIVVYFHENFLSDALLSKDETIKLKQLLQKSKRGIGVDKALSKTLLPRMHRLLKLEGLERLIELLNILNLISIHPNHELLASPGYTNTLKQGDTHRMSQVYLYIMQNFRRKISVTHVAEMIGMTPTSFSRYFKIHANRTFSEFVSEIRIGHACRLLIEGENIAQACYKCGFFTLSNFNKQFKAYTGMTPSAYKKEFS